METQKKTLEDLTPEIRAKIDVYKSICVDDLYSGKEYENYNHQMLVDYVDKIYSIVNKEFPVVIVAKDPIDYKRKFAMLNDERNQKIVYDLFLEKNKGNGQPEEIELLTDVDYKVKSKSHYLFLCSTYHRVYLMWYKFIQDEFKIDHSNKELLDWLYEHAHNNISRIYATAMFVLVLRMPKYIRRNSVGFHSTNSPAIEYENYGMYYVNGRKISKEIFEAVLNKTYTFDEFINEENEDIKASVVTLIEENFGNEELMKFLDAVVIDEKEIKHDSGHTETVRLWKTRKKFQFLSDVNGNPNQPYAWLEETCPSSGSKYFISTSAHFTDVIEVCKFHRMMSIPNELRYNFSKFNN